MYWRYCVKFKFVFKERTSFKGLMFKVYIRI